MINLNDTLLYRISRPIVTILFKILFRPKIIGKENILENTSVVLAGNHTSNLDCLLIISSTKRTIHFLAKDELIHGIKKHLFLNMGIIPVNRRIHDKEALKSAKEVLSQKKAIGIFPEGTINKTEDTIMPFKIGAVKMAHDTSSFIVPFVISGKYKLFGGNEGVRIEYFTPYKTEDDCLDNENKILMNKIKLELEKRMLI